jgi:hypothetical protein
MKIMVKELNTIDHFQTDKEYSNLNMVILNISRFNSFNETDRKFHGATGPLQGTNERQAGL